jgi:hypothetical protein
VLNGDRVSSWVSVSIYWNTRIIRSIERIIKGDFTDGLALFFSPHPMEALRDLWQDAMASPKPRSTQANAELL